MDFHLDRALEVLQATPRTLRSLLEDLSEPWVSSNEGPDTFSPWNVLGHLIHGEEDDWIPRVMARQYQDAVGPWRKYISILESGVKV